MSTARMVVRGTAEQVARVQMEYNAGNKHSFSRKYKADALRLATTLDRALGAGAVVVAPYAVGLGYFIFHPALMDFDKYDLFCEERGWDPAKQDSKNLPDTY